MRCLSIAETKTHLSAVVDSVEAGEEIIITRHGRPVARIVAELGQAGRDAASLLAAQREFLSAQSMVTEKGVDTVRRMRDGDRF